VHDAPHLDWAAQTASALCIAARWLSAASLAFTFCAFALALAGVRASLIVALILVLGLGQLYLAFRIEFDAGIFAGAAMRPGSWREFGAVLRELGWQRGDKTEHSSVRRAAGLARLVRYSGALLAAQIVLALVALVLAR